MRQTLLDKIRAREAQVVVVGVGWVGLPIAVELARAGFRTTGLDRDAERMRLLQAGESYIPDVEPGAVAPLVASGMLRGTRDPRVLAEADAVIVCVPTPLGKRKDPDLRFVVEAIDEIARHQHPGMLVALESTSYPGTTSEVVVPRLTRSAELGKDVFVAFSPERMDPGNRTFRLRNTPKIVGGATPACLEMATALYSELVDTLVPVSSTETAEMAKLLENTFRAVNIALVNEIALASKSLGVDPFEVVRAAATKPFGYMPFYPGPGLGGHCLPVDPQYLSWKLRSLDHEPRLIEVADAINSAMPHYVVERVAEALSDAGRPLRDARILIYGVAYKANVPDTRESPAIDVLLELRRRGARVEFMDPLVRSLDLAGVVERSIDTNASFAEYDAVVLLTNHDALDVERLVREARIVVDTRGVVGGTRGDSGDRIHQT